MIEERLLELIERKVGRRAASDLRLCWYHDALVVVTLIRGGGGGGGGSDGVAALVGSRVVNR